MQNQIVAELMVKVAVVMSNYNGYSSLYKNKPIIEICLESLSKTNYKDYKVVLTDGNSTDDSVDFVRKKYPKINIVLNKGDRGVAFDNNNGIRFAIREYDPEYIIQVNNDIIFEDRNWLRKLVDVAESDSSIGIVGCKLVYPDKRIQHAGILIKTLPVNRGRGMEDTGKYDEIEEIDAVISAVMLIRRSVIDKIGLLDERMYRGPDEVDYCMRAHAAGFKIIYDGKLELVHLEGFTSTYSQNPERRDKIYYKRQASRLYFTFKHFGFFHRLKVLLIILGSGFFTIEGQDRQRKMSNIKLRGNPLHKFGLTLKAISEGYSLYKDYRKNQSLGK